MSLEQILLELVQGNGPVRDPARYFLGSSCVSGGWRD